MATSPGEGSSVGRYRLVRWLAIGGFSDVWEATDATGTRVALKIGCRRGSASGTWMHGRHNALGLGPAPTGGVSRANTFSSEDVVRLFAAEVTRLRAAEGKRMPLLIDHGLHNGVPYLVTELLQRSWDHALATPQDFVEVLWALHELTAADISSHGDLKPEHVFRRADGSFAFVDAGFHDDQVGTTWTPAYNPWRTGGAAGDVVAVALMAWLRYAGELPLASRQAGHSVPGSPLPLGHVAPAPRGIAQWVDSVLSSAAEDPTGLHYVGWPHGRPKPTWMHSHAAAAKHLTASATDSRIVEPAGLLRPRTRSGVSAIVPPGWLVKESWTLQPWDGVGSMVVSSEPLDKSIDSIRYAAIQGELLRNHHADFVELAFVPHMFASGEAGFLRDFRWTAPDGRSIRQLQVYYAEVGRGFCAIATIPQGMAETCVSDLRAAFDSVRIERGEHNAF